MHRRLSFAAAGRLSVLRASRLGPSKRGSRVQSQVNVLDGSRSSSRTTLFASLGGALEYYDL